MANQIKYQVSFDVKQNDLNKLKASLQQLQKLKIGDIMKINDSDMATATSDLNRIKEQALNVEEALKKAFNTKLNTVNIDSFNQVLKQSGSSIEQVYSAFSRAGTSGENAFRSLSSHVLSTNIQLKETHGLLDKMAKTLTNTVKWNIASGAINSMSRAVEQAWGYTKSLDTSLNNIRIVTGKSAEEMGDFAIKANEAAQSLGKTTTDYTNAALIYAQQGLSDKEIEERAKITLMTANVTGQSTSDVSEELTAVWNGYKVSAEEAEVYIDRLAAVAATTASDLKELSTGMSKVAAAASAMGVGEDQLAAQLSTIISVTRQAPESVGTALRTVYARISDIKAGIDEDGVTLGNYSGKMAELGFNVLDAAGNLRDMGEVMEEIGNRWQDLTREQQISLAQTMAGQRQYSNLIALFDNFEKYNEALDTARNAAGTLQEQQDIYMESTAAHLQTLKAAVENIYDSLADTDSINGIVDGLTVAANVAANLVDSLGGGVPVLKMIGAVGLNVFSQQIAKGINTTITNFEIAKDNARQFEQALQTTQKWQGIPGLDEVTQKLLTNREQLLSLANMMNPEQFTGMQTMLNELTETANTFATLSTQQQMLDGIIRSVTALTDKWQGLQSVMRDVDAQEAVLDKISKQELAFKQLSATLDTYKNDLKDLGNKAVNGQEISSQLQTMRANLNTYMDKVKELVEQGQMQRHAQQVDKLAKKLEELPNNLPSDKLRAQLLSISSVLQGMTKNAGDSAAQMGQKLKDNFQSAATDISSTVNQIREKMQADMGQFDLGIERTQRGVSIENYVKIAGSISSIGVAIQQVQNLGSIWKNQDLSTGEKLLQTITNLGFTIPNLVISYQRLNEIFLQSAAVQDLVRAKENAENAALIAAENAKALATQANIKQQQAKIAMNHAEMLSTKGAMIAQQAKTAAINMEAAANTAAAKAQAAKVAADQAAEKAASAAMIAQKGLLATLVSNPYLIAAAAVVGLVVAYNKFTMSAKEAEQALDNFNKKQKEIMSNSQETKQKVSELENLREEYEELSQKAGLYDQNINNLSNSEKQRWTQIKNKIAQINPEIVAAYNKQGEAILANNDALDQTINKLKQKNKLDYESWVNSSEFKQASKARGKNYDTETQKLEDLRTYESQIGTYSINDVNSSPISSFLLAQDVTNKEQFQKLQRLSELSDKNIKDFENQDIEEYREILNWLQSEENHNKELKALAQTNASDLLEILNGVIAEKEKARGQIVVGQQKVAVASNADSSAIMARLQAENGTKNQYEAIQKMGIENADAYILAFVQGHKQGAANNQDQLVAEAQDFENNLFLAFTRHENLNEIFKSVKNDIEKQGYETEEEYIQMFFSGINKAIQENQLQGENQDVLSAIINSIFNTKISGSNFDKTGLLDSYVSTSTELANEIIKEFQAGLGQNQKVPSLTDILSFDTQGVDLNSILTALGKVTDWSTDWHEILQQIVADQQTIQQQQNNIASLSSISQSGEKLQSGKNLSKKENQAYQENLDNVIETANQLNDKELIKSAELLKDTWLAGSEEYQQALDKVLQKLIEIKTEQANQEGREFTQEQIADIEKYANTIERVNELYQSGTIKDEVHYHALFNKALNEELKTLKISGSTFKNYTDQLKNLRKQTKSAVDGINNLGEEVNLSDEALQQMALNDLKLVDSLQKLQKSYKNLKDDLNADPGSMKFMNAMSELVGIINNIPGIHIDLTNENAIDYLTNVKEIAQGADGAIQRLRQKLAEQEIKKIQVEAELDERSISITVLNRLNELIQQLSPEDIQTHAYLQDKVFVDQLNALIRNAGLTADQCNRILSKIGVKANVTTRKIALPSDFTPGAPIVGGALANSANEGIKKNPIPSMQEFEIPDKITYEPINSSENNGNIISSDGGKKSGGGGGGKSSKPDTSQKETKEELKKEVDLYHDINIEIGDLNRKLDNTQKKQDRLYGKDLLNNLNQQNDILDQQIGKLEEKYQLQKQDQTQKQTQLKELGVIFDGYGKIGNYMDLLKTKQTEINELIKEYNELIKQYNETTDEARKKELNQQISELDKKIQHETQKMNNLKKGMDEYDKLMDDMQENEDQREEKRQKQFQNNMKKFRTEIEIRLDMGEAERDWNNFRRNVLNHSNILKESDFDKTLKDVTQNYQDVLSYFDVHGQIGSLEALTNQLLATQEELDQINDGGESSIYGDNKKQAMEDLQNDLDELMQQMEDVEGLIDSIDKAYLDTIDDIMDQFDKQIEDYELIGDLIEHDINLLSLLYGDRNYDAMDRYYTTLRDNNLKQLDSLRQQRDFWKEQWDAAVARGDSEAAKKFEEHYKETINNLNSLIEESAQNLQDKYLNAIDSIFDALDKKISNGLGTDYLSTSWQLMNKNADEYLDTINSAFAVQELEDKFQNAINDTKNLKNQQALKKLMDQQLDNLRAKEKLTEYDVERAEKLLQIEQARIALEDAQASKTSMRLKRDSQGNYSYEYIADQGNIREAEQGLAAAQNDLYNFDKDRYQSNLDDMLSAWKDFQEEYKEIVTDVSLSEEQRVANLALLRQQYGQYINDKTAENAVIRSNLMDSAFADIAAIYQTDVANYQQMADDEKNILMGDLVPAWQSGIQQMADKVAGEGGFIPVCQDAFEEITEATENYKDELDNMARVAEVDLNDVKQGVDVLSDSFSDLIEKNDDLLDRMSQEMNSIEQLRDAVHNLMEEYEDVYEAAKKAASAIHETLQMEKPDIFNDEDDEDDDEIKNDLNMSINNSGKNYASDESLSNSLHYNSATGEIESGLEWWLKKKSASSNSGNHTGDIWKLVPYETGGYTGTWAGNEGKIALLHQKELVLNSNDTKNLLDTITILKSITDSLNGNLFTRMNDIKSGFYNNFSNNDELEQNVHMDVSFPNVNSKREIEEALSDLVNLAAQRAMRR